MKPAIARCTAALVITLIALCGGASRAAVGLAEIAAADRDGAVTVFYPSADAARPLQRGRLLLLLAEQGVPARGNGRLVMISHGSGGAPWAHVDLASRLVEAGFIVAMPEHHADNARDDSQPGPDSWTLRPLEVSRAIDAVGRDARFAPLLQLDRVGVYGMSAGGHTALSLAGGQWSPAGFKRHCEAHLAEDFHTCAGLSMRLTGGPLDGLKKWITLAALRRRFADETVRAPVDARVAAVVAAVPVAAGFEPASVAAPQLPVGLVTAGRDRWLLPRFHGEAVLRACASCQRIADLPTAGHGALLSPLPPGLTGLLGELLNDPPGFERSQLAEVDGRIVAFFVRHLLPLKR